MPPGIARDASRPQPSDRTLGDAVAGEATRSTADARPNSLKPSTAGEQVGQRASDGRVSGRGQDRDDRQHRRDAGNGARPQIQQRRGRQAERPARPWRSVASSRNTVAAHRRAAMAAGSSRRGADQERGGWQQQDREPDRDLVEARRREGADRDEFGSPAGARQIDTRPARCAATVPASSSSASRHGAATRVAAAASARPAANRPASRSVERQAAPGIDRPAGRQRAPRTAARRGARPASASRQPRSAARRARQRSSRRRTARRTRPAAPRRAARSASSGGNASARNRGPLRATHSPPASPVAASDSCAWRGGSGFGRAAI